MTVSGAQKRGREWAGLEGFTRERFGELTKIDPAVWRKEVQDHAELFEKLKSRMPQELYAQREALERALSPARASNKCEPFGSHFLHERQYGGSSRSLRIPCGSVMRSDSASLARLHVKCHVSMATGFLAAIDWMMASNAATTSTISFGLMG